MEIINVNKSVLTSCGVKIVFLFKQILWAIKFDRQWLWKFCFENAKLTRSIFLFIPICIDILQV